MNKNKFVFFLNLLIEIIRDLCNGFLIAEIFSWYYPEHIRMGSFNTGQSLESKMSNWSMLKKVKILLNIILPYFSLSCNK